jgi:branched-chain amino acid transport system permease protein
MAVSLNLTVGVLGELSLGHAGFMSVGAFSGVVACMSLADAIPSEPIRLVVGIVIGAVCAGLAGVLVGIPVLRLNGDYLAIVTLAFGEIIKNLINCLSVGVDARGLHFSFLSNASALNLGEGGKIIINGPMGISGIPKLSTFTAGFILILVTLFIVMNLVNSRAGRAIMALRDNRIAAESVGIPITKYKLMAFVTSAALAGAAGTLYALNFSTIVASKFNFNTSILILVYVVLGGLGNIWGSVVAATVLTILPEMLRGFNDYRMLLYAIVLILVMLATNNVRIRNTFHTLRGRFKKTSKEGASDEQ